MQIFIHSTKSKPNQTKASHNVSGTSLSKHNKILYQIDGYKSFHLTRNNGRGGLKN